MYPSQHALLYSCTVIAKITVLLDLGKPEHTHRTSSNMTRAISEQQRARLIFLHGQRSSQEEIAEELQCSERTVRRWIQRYRETGTMQELKRTGRRRVTTPQEDSRIVRIAEDWPTTSMTRRINAVIAKEGGPTRY